MKSFKKLILVIFIGTSFTFYSQETKVTNETTADKKSYYQKRALEDAKYEQQFTAEVKADEEAFWQDQKTYEDNLKRKDRKAYGAYMKSKKDAYANHYYHCNSHCHHSDYYYHHASFYYHGYYDYYYERYPRRRNTINTDVRVNTPSVRVGLGLF